MISCPNPPDSADELEDLPRVAYFGNLSWHPGGDWIAVDHADSIDTNHDGSENYYFFGLWLIDVDSGEKSPFMLGVSEASWSADGSMLAFVSQGNIYTIEVINLYPIEIDTSSLTQITFEGSNYAPDWSPDGKKIVYESNLADSKYDIWIANLELEQTYNISGASDSSDQGGWRNPDWSPQGNLITHERYITGGDIGTEIAVMDTLGSNALHLTLDSGGPDYGPKFSSNGDKIGYLGRTYNGVGEWAVSLYSILTNGSNKNTVIENNVSSFDWSPDGEKIVFTYYAPENYSGSGELWLNDIGTGVLTQLTFGNE